MQHSVWLWVGFNVFVILMLAIDLGVFHRRAHKVRVREAALWTALWITLALVFNVVIGQTMGRQAGLEFLTGYLIEKALSVDNLFVFVLIFSYFRVPEEYQHRVLFWGVLGALLMRGAMIGAGSILIYRFHWILYVFGLFLVVTGIRMAVQREISVDLETSPVLRLARRYLPVSPAYQGQRFFIRERYGDASRWAATPLFIVLLLVETTDVVFAVDSIPAIFAVTRDPFLVYTSNVFAILGLRSLYFLLADVVHRFHYLKLGLAGVLSFVGVKMLIADLYKIPIGLSLGLVATVLTASVVASLLFPREVEEIAEAKEAEPPPASDPLASAAHERHPRHQALDEIGGPR